MANVGTTLASFNGYIHCLNVRQQEVDSIHNARSELLTIQDLIFCCDSPSDLALYQQRLAQAG